MKPSIPNRLIVLLQKLRAILLLPTLADFRRWELPSKHGLIGLILGILSFAFAIYAYVIPYPAQSKIENYQQLHYLGGDICIFPDNTYDTNKLAIATQYLMSTLSKSFDTLEMREQHKKTFNALLKDAYPEIKKLAERGDVYALYWDGVYHELGQGGVTKDLLIAERQYKKSLPTVECARLSLATMYFDQGKKTEGYQLIIDSADTGHPKALARLAGILLLNPDLTVYGKRPNPIELLEQAAKAREPYAYYRLGLVYLKGEGTQPDHSKALFYFNEGAKYGSDAAAYELAMLYGDENPQLHRKWLEVSARSGYVDAQFQMGKELVSGGASALELQEGIKWLTFASESNTDAMSWLGQLHERGLGFEKDKFKAYHYYCYAASLGNENALFNLSRLSTDWKLMCTLVAQKMDDDEFRRKNATCAGIASCESGWADGQSAQ